jgi:hypothetical protein
MRIRYLRRQSDWTVVSVWPPQWASSSEAGQTVVVGEDGVLESVTRLAEGLSLTMTVQGCEYVGSLLWDAPPSRDDVENALQANLGRSIKVIGDLDFAGG